MKKNRLQSTQVIVFPQMMMIIIIPICRRCRHPRTRLLRRRHKQSLRTATWTYGPVTPAAPSSSSTEPLVPPTARRSARRQNQKVPAAVRTSCCRSTKPQQQYVFSVLTVLLCMPALVPLCTQRKEQKAARAAARGAARRRAPPRWRRIRSPW